MTTNIVVAACYCCGWPVRVSGTGVVGVAVDPATLPISDALARGLTAWQEQYDGTLDQDDPPSSGFVDAEVEDAFWADGLVLAARLAIELVDSHTVTYRDGRREPPERSLLSGGAVRLLDGRIILPGSWRDLSGDRERREALLSQLERELPEEHVLRGRRVAPLAHCGICDDVLFHVPEDATYALTHLTWRRSRETAPHWPWTELHTDPAALLADTTERHWEFQTE